MWDTGTQAETQFSSFYPSPLGAQSQGLVVDFGTLQWFYVNSLVGIQRSILRCCQVASAGYRHPLVIWRCMGFENSVKNNVGLLCKV